MTQTPRHIIFKNNKKIIYQTLLSGTEDVSIDVTQLLESYRKSQADKARDELEQFRGHIASIKAYLKKLTLRQRLVLLCGFLPDIPFSEVGY